MSTITAKEARRTFTDLLARAAYGKERVTVTRNGKPVAVLVPLEDAEALEAMEDRRDADDVEKALAEMKRDGERLIPWEEAKKRLRPRVGTKRRRRSK